MSIIRWLRRTFIDMSGTNYNFIDACRNGDLPRVKALLKRGADIHDWDDYALRGAARKGYLDVVKYLVEQGANIHAWDNQAFREAAEEGHLDVVKYLKEHGVNTHAVSGAFRMAAYYGQLDVVKYLVEQGANIHADADSALKWATIDEHLAMVNYLRETAGPRYKCYECLIKSTCLKLCKDFRAGEE